MKPVTRRTFIQNSALLTLLSAGPRQLFAVTKDTGWEPKRPINPHVDITRVVCAVNPSIISKNPVSWQSVSGCKKASEVETVALEYLNYYKSIMK
jgi:hypothetical protein